MSTSETANVNDVEGPLKSSELQNDKVLHGSGLSIFSGRTYEKSSPLHASTKDKHHTGIDIRFDIVTCISAYRHLIQSLQCDKKIPNNAYQSKRLNRQKFT